MKNSGDIIINFTNDFRSFYLNPDDLDACRSGRVMLIACVASCFSICSPSDRDEIMNGIIRLALDIGDEKFEDMNDFIHFLKDKFL